MIKFYKIFFPIFFTPVILILSIFSKKIRAGMKQKLGFYNFKIDKKTFWVHAVSVGEINSLTEHFKAHPKDNHSKRGLLRKVAQRKGLLEYLVKNDVTRYRKVVKELGLRK